MANWTTKVTGDIIAADHINKIQKHINWVVPEDYGAVGDGVTDDTTAIQAAIDAAQTDSLPLFLGPKDYAISGIGSQIILVDGGLPFNIIGCGASQSRIMVLNTTGATTDHFRVTPGTGQAMSGFVWRDFAIIATTRGTTGRHCLHFDFTSAAAADIISRFRMEGVLLQAGTGNALYVNNTDAKTEAWYYNYFNNCIFNGGAYLHRVGDHNMFENSAFAYGTPALFITMVSLAGSTASHNLVFKNCSFSLSTGAITVEDCYDLVFDHCQVETTDAADGQLVKIVGDQNPAHNVLFESCGVGLTDPAGSNVVVYMDNTVGASFVNCIIATTGTGYAISTGTTNMGSGYVYLENNILSTTGSTELNEGVAGAVGYLRDETGVIDTAKIETLRLVNGSEYVSAESSSDGYLQINPSGHITQFNSPSYNNTVYVYDQSSANIKSVVISGNSLAGYLGSQAAFSASATTGQITTGGKVSPNSIDITSDPLNVVSNGGFDSAATGWTAAFSTSTLASVAGGQSGNCLQVTRVSGTAQYVYQNITTVVGKTYTFSCYVKSGTSGDETYNFGVGQLNLAADLQHNSGTSSSSWVSSSFTWTADRTNPAVYVLKSSGTAGTMLFDTISVVEFNSRNLTMVTGDTPTDTPTDGYRQYSADIVAGNAAPHFRTENGTVIKLDQAIDTAASPTFAGLNIVGGTGTTRLFSHQADALADDGTVNLPDATSGMVLVSCNAEAGMWLVQADGTCTKISGSANTADTDSDTDLCVFNSAESGEADTAVVKNRLGAAGEIRIIYYYN